MEKKVASDIFQHLQRLSLRFHLSMSLACLSEFVAMSLMQKWEFGCLSEFVAMCFMQKFQLVLHLFNFTFFCFFIADRKTGVVLRSVQRGATSFAEAGRIVLFQFFPVILQV